MKKCAPIAISYLIQSNLLLFALQNLDAPTFQVIQQSKILITAFLCVYFLHKKIDIRGWISLVTLVFGMILVVTENKSTRDYEKSNENYTGGLLATVLAAFISASASVYFEKIVNHSQNNLVRLNVYLGYVSLLLTGFALTLNVHWNFANKEILIISICKGIGGLLVAVITKYLGSVTKCLATAVSIVIGCIVSALYLDVQFTMTSTIGTILSLISCLAYGFKDVKTVNSHDNIKLTV